MNDDLFRRFASLDRPADPDPGFAEHLLGDLVDELGFRSGRRRTLGVRWRLLSPRFLPSRRTTARLAYIAGLVGILVAALGAAFVASQVGPSAEQIVERSQAVYDDPPAFTMTFEASGRGTYALSSNGAGTWRVDVATSTWEESVGSYTLYSGERVGHYEPRLNAWHVDVLQGPSALEILPPYPLGMEFTWTVPIDMPSPTQGAPRDWRFARVECGTWELLGTASIAGRAVDRVLCPDTDLEFWIDRESGLILALEPGPEARGLELPGPVRALSLSFAPPAAALFDWDGPAGSFDLENLPASVRLVNGQRAPQWTGRLVGGEAFDTDDLAGRPAAAYFWAPWCDPCTKLLPDLSAAAERHVDIRTVTVGVDSPANLARFVEASQVGLPVIVDGGGESSLMRDWGIHVLPSLVLLDADGRVVETIIVQSADHLARAYAALALGEPVPGE